MKELKLLEQIAINNANFSIYQAMAFDGDCYYFCVDGRKVIDIYDLNFHNKKICNVKREYGCITYSSKHKYFYAIPKYNANIIIKLDKNMQEIGYIDITNFLCNEKYITSISYSCNDDSIVLSSKNKVYKLSIKSSTICEIIVLDCNNLVKVISISPGYILISEEEEMYKILIYNCDLNIVNQLYINKCNVLCDVLFNPCESNCNNRCDQCMNLYFLMNKDKNCSKLFKVPTSYSEFCYELCDCNFDICQKPPKPCKEISTVCIIEAIALIQVSIAHILNAEGEKIQKVVANSNNMKEILCVNKEVEQMIVKITHLEQVLYDSLVELNNCDGSYCCSKCNSSCCDKDDKCLCDVDGGKL